MESRLTGLIAAPFTAMKADGSLNLAMIELQAAALAENGVNGAFICGTTGEGLSLLHPGRAAYSCLAVLPDKSVACLFECSKKSPYEKISLARIPPDWLEKDAIPK